MKLLYVNDTYEEHLSIWYDVEDVKLPQKGTEYTLKAVSRKTDGSYCITVKELENLVKHRGVMVEVSFPYWRFSDSGPGGVLDWENVKKIYDDNKNNRDSR